MSAGAQLRQRRPGPIDGDEARASIPERPNDLVEHYEDAQLSALKIAFLGAALLVVVSFFFTSRLPTRRFDELEAERGPPVAAT